MGNVVKQTLALAELPSPENSPITETSFGAESPEDGVYNITTTTPAPPASTAPPPWNTTSPASASPATWERIADLATDICRQLIYLRTGCITRHSGTVPPARA